MSYPRYLTGEIVRSVRTTPNLLKPETQYVYIAYYYAVYVSDLDQLDNVL